MCVGGSPWSLTAGRGLLLPPLENAQAARFFLRRVLAPRHAQRFASAREALWALKRVRAGGTRLSRTAVAAARVAAAALAAVFVGAGRRSPPAETQKPPAPEVVQGSGAGAPAPQPQPATPPPPPPPDA